MNPDTLRRFAVGRADTVKDGFDVRHLYHYSHLDTARCALLAKSIKVQPERRKSLPGPDAVFLSPTEYAPGSRFGHIGFVFPAKQLLGRARVFYAGISRSVGNRFRFIISLNDVRAEGVREVNPESDELPFIKLNDETWRVNSAQGVSVELAFAEDIDVTSCAQLRLTEHNTLDANTKCERDTCPDATQGDAGARLLAGMLAEPELAYANALLHCPSFCLDPLDQLLSMVVKPPVSGLADDTPEPSLKRALVLLATREDALANHELAQLKPSKRREQLTTLVASSLPAYAKHLTHYLDILDGEVSA